MPSSTAAAIGSPSAALSKPSPAAGFVPLNTADSTKPSAAIFINSSPVAANTRDPTVAAANTDLPASTTAAAPAFPPGFEEYILAQKAQFPSPASVPGAVLLPNTKQSSIPVTVGDKDAADDDGTGEGLEGTVIILGSLVDKIGGPVLLIGLLIDEKHHKLGSLQLTMALSCTWCVCLDWFWYNDGFDIMASELVSSSTSKRRCGDENSSHEDDSTELN